MVSQKKIISIHLQCWLKKKIHSNYGCRCEIKITVDCLLLSMSRVWNRSYFCCVNCYTSETLGLVWWLYENRTIFYIWSVEQSKSIDFLCVGIELSSKTRIMSINGTFSQSELIKSFPSNLKRISSEQTTNPFSFFFSSLLHRNCRSSQWSEQCSKSATATCRY